MWVTLLSLKAGDPVSGLWWHTTAWQGRRESWGTSPRPRCRVFICPGMHRSLPAISIHWRKEWSYAETNIKRKTRTCLWQDKHTPTRIHTHANVPACPGREWTNLIWITQGFGEIDNPVDQCSGSHVPSDESCLSVLLPYERQVLEWYKSSVLCFYHEKSNLCGKGSLCADAVKGIHRLAYFWTWQLLLLKRDTDISSCHWALKLEMGALFFSPNCDTVPAVLICWRKNALFAWLAVCKNIF